MPKSWVSASLTDVCEILDHKRVPVNNRERNRRIAGRLDADLYPYFGATGQAGVIDDFIFDGEYILLGEDGAPFLEPLKDQAYLVQGRFWVNNHAHILRSMISNKYVCHYLNTVDYSRYVTGTTRLKLTKNALDAIPIHFPSIAEQYRIVAKIAELFSELDKGIESLKKARAQLATYRQAVLKHAFEGKLTAHWREENKDILETSKQLSTRIKQERKAIYLRQIREREVMLKTWSTSATTSKRLSKLRRPNELPSTGELADLPPLPEGYVYTMLGNLGSLERGVSKHRPRNAPELFGGPYPFIQTGEIKAADRVIREHRRTYSELGLRQSKLWPQGTLCITIAASIAETAILGFDSCFPDSVVAYTATKALVLPIYVELFVKSVRTRIESYAPATAQKNINLAVLENLFIPICSLREQRILVERVAAILSVIQEQQEEIDRCLYVAASLRQSILKKAFTGQLVTQDPSDESASVLLERIRAEREQVTESTTRRKTGPQERAEVIA